MSGHPCELDYHGEHPLQPPEVNRGSAYRHSPGAPLRLMALAATPRLGLRGDFVSLLQAMALCETLSELQGVDENQLCRNNSRALKDESRRPAEGLPSEGIVGVLDMHSYGQMVLGSWAHLNLKPADQ